MSEISELKQQNRAVWAAGDYDTVAEKILDVGRRIVQRAGVGAGDDVLDVACGTGNAAIPAAQAGGRVVGVDLTPELFEAARARADAAGVEVEWLEGDAEALQFEDESFDVVLSTFGCMFAPRHDATARELARVLRSGGRLGLANWTPEGAVGDFFKTLAGHLPPPPDIVQPPPLWGSEEHVRELLGDGLELVLERETVDMHFPSVDEAVAFYETNFGPVVTARELLEPEGRWEAVREEMAAMFERNNSADDGSLLFRAEYLAVLGRKAN
jgi:SAM-dependent methyltransferase